MRASNAAELHTPQARRAGRDLLSLALLDARNRTLRWCTAFDAGAPPGGLARTEEHDPPWWLIGRAGWFQERWIARHVQRQRGALSDPQGTRLASIDPEADRLYEAGSRADRWALQPLDPQRLRTYLAETLEVTLDLLASAADDDAALHFYRLALFHEDLCAEALAEVAQAVGVAPGEDATAARELVAPCPAFAPRPALWFPATHWALGAKDGSAGAEVAGQRGFIWPLERGGNELALPEFEIDAQPVSWAQFTEFTQDGGYDELRWWSAQGWQWLQRDGRRVPRYVEQMRAGVLQARFGNVQRVPLAQPAVHVSLHEAEAWCRWAGRRLPTEAEWDHAAHTGVPRGFRWGAVREWTASPLRPYPGQEAGASEPWAPQPAPGTRAVRGASVATPPRLHDAARRSGLPPPTDIAFVGFRSCAA